MKPKPGLKTTEFWITAVVNIAGAIITLLAAYGFIRREEQTMWVQLVQSLAVAVVPLVIAIVNYAYIESRGKVKAAASQNGDRSN